MTEPEVRFEDGNLTPVVRVGATVRRSPGPWTPAVHALLRHLAAVGFEAAPRALGFDEQGREMLSYVDGTTVPASLEGFRSDDLLVSVARLLRRYHDAVATFQPLADSVWQVGIGAPTTGEVVCHNDIAPWNTVIVGGQPIAFIDWDLAAPGPRIWDVAYALWRFAPLYDDDAFGSPEEQARRMALFCDAYGLADRTDLVETIERRQQSVYDTLATWARDGLPAYVALWEGGHADGVLRDLDYLRRHRTTFEAIKDA